MNMLMKRAAGGYPTSERSLAKYGFLNITASGTPRFCQLQTRCSLNPYFLETSDGPPRRPIASRCWLHMGKSVALFMACCNMMSNVSLDTVTMDHESFRRLMLAAEHRRIGKDTQTQLAKMIGTDVATVSNWRRRGVSAPAAIELANILRVDAGWMMGLDGAPAPDFVGYQTTEGDVSRSVAQRRMTYGLNDEERIVLDGFRVGEQWARRSMVVLAMAALAEQGRRASNGCEERNSDDQS